MSLACPSLIAGYDPGLCAAIDHYCERTSSALDAEPVNALTNAAFLIAAVGAWRLQSARPAPGTAGPIRALIVLIAIVGLGSFLFHTVATRWAEWGDVIPILAFMLLFLWLVLSRFLGWSFGSKLVALSCFLAVTLYLEAAVPGTVLWGGALYVPALLVLVAVGAALYRRQRVAARAAFTATGVFLLSLAARMLDMPVCTIFPRGTHFLWHIFNAILLYLLVRLAILYAPSGPAASR